MWTHLTLFVIYDAAFTLTMTISDKDATSTRLLTLEGRDLRYT